MHDDSVAVLLEMSTLNHIEVSNLKSIIFIRSDNLSAIYLFNKHYY